MASSPPVALGRERFFRAFAYARVFVAPVVAVIGALAATFGPTWRVVTLAVAIAVIAAVSIYEAHYYRRHGRFRFGERANLLVLIVGQLAAVTATGGLSSPIVPGMAVFGVVLGIFASGSLHLWVPLLIQGPWIFGIAAVHAYGLLPEFQPPFMEGLMDAGGRGLGPWVMASVLSLLLILAPRMGRVIRALLLDAHQDLLTSRDRELRSYGMQQRELEMLTSQLAHDLKNPLTSLVGVVRLLERETTGRASEHVQILGEEVGRMRTVVRELLDFTRPVVPLECRQVDFAAVVSSVAALHEGLAQERDVRVECVTADDLFASADERKVRNVLVNVLQNALDASPPGGRVVVSATRGANAVEVSVRDQGEGIDEQVVKRIFEAGVTTKSEGSGLGLTISRALMAQHDGTIDFLPGPGGTVVRLRFPARRRTKSAPGFA
ncbi:MAG: HAMP domain-containing sensor histidine kinase [Myxococcota bacterium]